MGKLLDLFRKNRLLRKTGYVLSYLLATSLIFLFFRIPKARGIIKEVCLDENFSWSRGKRLFVSNHPSWLDQFFSIALRLPYWGLDYLPYIAVANDSVNRIPFLKILKDLAFVVPIERRGESWKNLDEHIKKMKDILNNGYNLMVAGAPGRDAKCTEEEIIFSPIKKKRFRRFTELPGLLAILPGIETVPFCIDGTQEFYEEVIVDGRREIKFSPRKFFWRFFIKFWLLGRIKIWIIYGRPLILEGKSKIEASRIIQEGALNLLDLC